MSLILPSTLSAFNDMLDHYIQEFTGDFNDYRHHYITVIILNHLYYTVPSRSSSTEMDVNAISEPQYEVLLSNLCNKNHLSQTERENIVNYYMYHQGEVSSKFQLCIDTIERNFTNGELLSYGV